MVIDSITEFISDYAFLIVALLGLILLFITRLLPQMLKEKHPPKRCRNCGTTEDLIILYEDGGVCRKCFDEIIKLPGVLKDTK